MDQAFLESTSLLSNHNGSYFQVISVIYSQTEGRKSFLLVSSFENGRVVSLSLMSTAKVRMFRKCFLFSEKIRLIDLNIVQTRYIDSFCVRRVYQHPYFIVSRWNWKKLWFVCSGFSDVVQLGLGERFLSSEHLGCALLSPDSNIKFGLCSYRNVRAKFWWENSKQKFFERSKRESQLSSSGVAGWHCMLYVYQRLLPLSCVFETAKWKGISKSILL